MCMTGSSRGLQARPTTNPTVLSKGTCGTVFVTGHIYGTQHQAPIGGATQPEPRLQPRLRWTFGTGRVSADSRAREEVSTVSEVFMADQRGSVTGLHNGPCHRLLECGWHSASCCLHTVPGGEHELSGGVRTVNDDSFDVRCRAL